MLDIEIVRESNDTSLGCAVTLDLSVLIKMFSLKTPTTTHQRERKKFYTQQPCLLL